MTTDLTTRAGTTAPTPKRSGFRGDLQGLRGLGVICVVFGHLFRTPSGIFTALDMFFVLSGFWITAILIDSYDRMGRIYFVPFYLNRLRRLAPMAIVVLAATVAAFYLLFSEARGSLVLDDALWALLWVVNWHFAATGSNYFVETTQSPVVHYWSLSVEEQFYAVWPLLIFVGLLAGRRMVSNRRALVLTLSVVTLASFCYSVWHSTASPAVAYYSTLDRVWEFGVGGLVAVARPSLSRLPRRLAQTLSWGGSLGLALPIFLIEYGMPFPGPWALPVVALTAMVLAGGVGRDTKYLWIFDNRAMVYIGDISYSVYLWHLPVQMALLAYFPDPEPLYYAVSVTTTAVLAVVSFHLIESPLRFAPWLMIPPERQLMHRALARRAAQMGFVRAAWGFLGAGVVVAVAVVMLLPTKAPVIDAPQSTFPSAQDGPSADETQVEQQQRRIAEALSAQEFPAFDPPLSELGLDRWADDQKDYGCLNVYAGGLEKCRFGPEDAPRTAVLVGDSHGIGWAPTVRKALVPEGWAVQQLTFGECGSWTLPSYLHADRTAFPQCREHHELVERYVLEEKPELVILTSATLQVRNAERPELDTTEVGVARDGLTRTIEALEPSGSRIVVLSPPPGSKNLVDCVTRAGSPQDCIDHLSNDWRNHVRGETAAAEQAAVEYIPTLDWFCRRGRCPGFVGETPVTVDGSHVSIPYAESLGPLLREALLGSEDEVAP